MIDREIQRAHDDAMIGTLLGVEIILRGEKEKLLDRLQEAIEAKDHPWALFVAAKAQAIDEMVAGLEQMVRRIEARR